jgi:protoporphyrin/coproporphyrin ferrochelatase
MINMSPEDFKKQISSDNQTKTGILLIQLGTPENASVPAVKAFIKELLTDPFMIPNKPAFWSLILNGIILPKQAKKSAKIYDSFFQEHGQTIITITNSLTLKLYENLSATNPFIVIRSAMRYSKPHITSVLDEMITEQGVEKLLIIPLFPQYSHTTTGSIQDVIKKHLKTLKTKPKARFIGSFCSHTLYINTLSELINTYVTSLGTQPERLLLSYHGLPVSHIKKGDPYENMCLTTSNLLKEYISFPPKHVLTSYQSRFGKEEWLTPYTEDLIIKLAQEGIKRLAVCAPSFTIDCVETLYEIGKTYKELFLKNGGERLDLMPCLNDQEAWVLALSNLIKEESAKIPK